MAEGLRFLALDRPLTALATLLVFAELGCAPRFEQMQRDLEHLRLPTDYVLIEEQRSGTSTSWMGDLPRVVRKYRAPRGFATTCEEIRRAGEAFSNTESRFSRHEGGALATCTAAFARRRFTGGITATDVVEPELARRLGGEERPFVRVDVQIIDP